MQTSRQPGFQEKVSVTNLKQSAFGVNSTDLTADLSMCMPLKSSAIPMVRHTTKTRDDLAGHEFPQTVDIYRKEVAWTPPFEADMRSVLWHMAFAMGQAATTGAGPYTHTLKLMTSRAMPLTSIVHEGHHDGKRNYFDLACEGFTITGQGEVENTLEIRGDWFGSGEEDVSVTHTSPSIVVAPRMRMGLFKFELGAFGAEVDLTGMINSFTFGFKNNHFGGHRPGGGYNASRAEVGNRRTPSLQFTIEADNATDWTDYVRNLTLLSAKLTLIDDGADADQVVIHIPQLIIKDPEASGGEQMDHNVNCDLLFDPARAGYSAGNQGPFYVVATTAAALEKALLGAMTA